MQLWHIPSYIMLYLRCVKFPKEKKLKKYISDITGAVVSGHKSLESLSKVEQANSKEKVELFGFLPPKTKKSILLQSSGKRDDFG